ncbi:MAG: inorganic phosphate transporter [Phycisphaerae bacterium]|nr:inorganic phosphate transporter [Phycisphaerae bacterium]
MTTLVIIALVVGVYMAWNIGANDVANSMADAVGSKALTIFWAVVLAGIFEFAGAFLVGSDVAQAIRKNIINVDAEHFTPQTLAHGMLCAMLAAAVWLNLASYLGLPVSATHSIVGAILGFGIIEVGFSIVSWGTLGKIVASWFISPIAGGLMAYFIFKLISKHILSKERPIKSARKGVPVVVFFTFSILILATIYKGLKNLHLHLGGWEAIGLSVVGGLVAAIISWFVMGRNGNSQHDLCREDQIVCVEKIFVPLVIISSCTVAFAHGANDVANAIGPLAVVYENANAAVLKTSVDIPMWILALGGGGIVLGLASFGYRVMTKVGMDVTEITPSRGVAADIAAMATVLACSKMGLPISTTHTLVGAIIGVGLARGITALNKNVIRSIFTSWLVTVPIAAILSMVFYIGARWIFWSEILPVPAS